MQRYFEVILDWPDWRLSPNGTRNRAYKAALVKAARTSARIITLSALGKTGGERPFSASDKLFSVWIFSPPNARRRDTGNMRAAMKPYQDGIFDALGIDDSAVRDEYLRRAHVVKNGAVILRLYNDRQKWLDDVVALATST